MSYQPEELLVVVEDLIRRYTSGESTSVTYETAQRLMGAAMYGIFLFEAEFSNKLSVKNGVPPMVAYQRGYELLLQKVKKVKDRYNEKILTFHAYENENYYDTVTKGIPGFFQCYDPRFSPQDNIITMDYRTITPIGNRTGILAIEKYLEFIYLEQEFLSKWSQDYVISVLDRAKPPYRKQFYNICTIILRHVLGSIMVCEIPYYDSVTNSYEILTEYITEQSKENLLASLESILEGLIRDHFDQNQNMFQYFHYDLEEFTVELMNGATHNTLQRVVVLQT